MKKAFLVCLIFVLQIRLQAQEGGEESVTTVELSPNAASNGTTKLQKPLGRIKSLTGVNNESSSFIGDPDNLDPLNPNRENLKEDEEPVLEDIKQVLEAPKKTEEKPDAENVSTVEKTPVGSPEGSGIAEREPKKRIAKSKKRIAKLKVKRVIKPDEPDLKLEKKFNTIYRTYNIDPTPDGIWAAATSKQSLREYIVQKGDTLWSISQILFGDANFWPKIWALNKQGILNPHFIYPNSKIYFYMGDEESAPTLSVGTPDVEGGSGERPVDQRPGAQLHGEAEDGNIRTPMGDMPAKIPDSLPLHRNYDYFVGKKISEIQIDLGISPTYEYEASNDIYITDKPIRSEVAIQISETAKFRCYEGRILRDIKYIGGLVEEYDIFEPLDNFKTDIGKMYAYRIYGKARPYLKRNLKLSNCSSLLTTDLVIIPKDKIQLLRNKQVTPNKKVTLIGGPDVTDQKLFTSNQVAYVDFGSYIFEPGQEYKVMSQVTDEINGQIKIIEKYGSFAVVMLTEVNDTVEIGDTVILK